MKIEVHGDNGVILSIEKYTSTEKLIGAVQSACAVVEAAAIKNAPKRSGDLRRSIESNVEGNGNEIKGTISTPLEYAPYVEYGTGLYAEGGNGRKEVPWAYKDEKTGELIWTAGQHPHPFMRPALNDNRNAIIATIKEGIGK